MAAVPDADRMHTSSLSTGERRHHAPLLLLFKGNLYILYGVVLMYIPDAGALAVAHHGVATESFGVRFDLLSNLLPPGVPRFWLICKTQIPLQAALAAHSPMLQRGT